MAETNPRDIQSTEIGAMINSVLDDVRHGQIVGIIHNGERVARIMPEEESQTERVTRLLHELDEMKKNLPPISLEEIIASKHEGHKY